MALRLLLLLVICGRFGDIDGAILPPDDQSQTWHDFMTSVNLKFDRMERLLAEKDTQIAQIETKLNNEIQKKDSEIAQLKHDILVITSRKDTILQDFKKNNLDVLLDRIPENKVPQHDMDLRHQPDDDVTTTNTSSDNAGEESLPVDDDSPDVIQRTVSHQTRKTRVAEPSAATSVAFHVEQAGSLTVSNGLVIVYNEEYVDQGDGYNPSDGIYTVPETGTYFITWTTVSAPHGRIRTRLIVNGATRGYSSSDSRVTDEYHPSTQIFLLRLHKGEHVFIRVEDYIGGRLNSDSDGKSTFSGWKLSGNTSV